MKPGLLTTELWVIVAAVANATTGTVSTDNSVNIAAIAAAGVYAICRTYLKAKTPTVPGTSGLTALKQILASLFAPGVPVVPAPVTPPATSSPAAAAKPPPGG